MTLPVPAGTKRLSPGTKDTWFSGPAAVPLPVRTMREAKLSSPTSSSMAVSTVRRWVAK